ncbi:hypothetical protein PUNSTDRAFT_122754 [Punctularia strigosozonata HHB-11173 SS5]|uniref:Secreted protein n=1 Tax=Punctularia strigosozonata (strain HHB-11173) TaxID=741275 RepID=R7S4I2_PUNST|nr:uncharacterized protein PUNSTDRAFT_122754 [Punctularia strigosozonata HHB-11173 SS5]EIN04734.1 hypothetical protein PUNSTDRAFT_122754 [Punctularia strigosozonata HHB-11173 SS5]
MMYSTLTLSFILAHTCRAPTNRDCRTRRVPIDTFVKALSQVSPQPTRTKSGTTVPKSPIILLYAGIRWSPTLGPDC